MLTKWDYRFINLAKEVASWSKEGKQVGCVITDINTNKVLATGYNGLPKAVSDSCLCSLSKEDKAVLVLHAEHNCLEHLSKEDYNKDLALYVTKTPCRLCSIKIVNSLANIKKIYYIPSSNESFNLRYKVSESLSYLKNNGIDVIPINTISDYTVQITITHYLSTAKQELDIEYISYYIDKCSVLIDNLDSYLQEDTSKIDAICNILDKYGYENILKFVEEEESISPTLFLDWYKTNIFEAPPSFLKKKLTINI